MDYLELFYNFGEASPLSFTAYFFLTLFRIAPIVHFAPFFGAKVAPVIVRMGIAICISIIFMPFLMTHSDRIIKFDNHFILYSAKELLLGFIIGFFIAVPFYMAESAGILIDYMRGSSQMMSQDPTMQVQSSPIGNLYNYTLIVLFFQINGPFIFLDGVLKTYQFIPPDGLLSADLFNLHQPFWQLAMDLLNRIVAISIQIGAPSILAILMAEMFLGIANRLAPQVQIAFLGMALKSFLGLLLLCVSWFFVLKQIGKLSLEWVTLMTKMMTTFGMIK